MDTNSTPNITEQMSAFDLLLDATDKEDTISGGYVERPVWSRVEMRIERAFQFGGTVRLHLGKFSSERSRGFTSKEFLAMESLPGKYRLIFSPELRSLSEKSNLREWWESGDAPFRGTVLFGDDEWDARTVCSDITVVKQMFKDYFDNGKLTELGYSQMLSGWNRKPR